METSQKKKIQVSTSLTIKSITTNKFAYSILLQNFAIAWLFCLSYSRVPNRSNTFNFTKGEQEKIIEFGGYKNILI